MEFETDYKNILQQVERIDPLQYGKTRNYVNGAVTYLSPYISRGVISTRQVLKAVVLKGYRLHEMESFVKELCWRDYFQRVGQVKDLHTEIKNIQTPVTNYQIPSSIVEASTGIEAVDHAIRQLYELGYMHNHCRMYTASMTCNIGKVHWRKPAQWMYYHLLDGDWASNACSWQWVAGANSNKKYYANQENINKFCLTQQANTFLDVSYETIEQMPIPGALLHTQSFHPPTNLPNGDKLVLDNNLPTCIYNYHNLDPRWHEHEEVNRILLLDPDFFSLYPVSDNCIRFMMSLTKNIPGMQVYIGSFESLSQSFVLRDIYYKEHPFNKGYRGNEEPRDWIEETVTGYFPSFFSYWKKVKKLLEKQNMQR